MWPKHPQRTQVPRPAADRRRRVDRARTPISRKLTTQYTERAVRVHRAEQATSRSSSTCRTPCRTCRCSCRTSSRASRPAGLFGDVIEEIDWSVGQILAPLKQHGLDEQHAGDLHLRQRPVAVYGNHAGSAGPLREGKGTAWEGGVRVPFIARWPGRIPAGTVVPRAGDDDRPAADAGEARRREPRTAASTARTSGRCLRSQRDAEAPHEAYCTSTGASELQAVRSGKWKLHFPHAYQALETAGQDGTPGVVRKEGTGAVAVRSGHRCRRVDQPRITAPRCRRDPDDRRRRARVDLGDSLTKRVGAHLRPAGARVP